MNPFLQQMINHKIKEITPKELVQYGQNYEIKVTEAEAKKIIDILHEEKRIEINNHSQHKKIINKVAKKVNPTLAKKAEQLLQQFSNMF